jgi:hypothetical protein
MPSLRVGPLEADGIGSHAVVTTLRRWHLAEGVPETMHGPDKTGVNGIIIECRADFTHQIREVLLHHESAGPEVVLQLGLGERLGWFLTRMPSS